MILAESVNITLQNTVSTAVSSVIEFELATTTIIEGSVYIRTEANL